MTALEAKTRFGELLNRVARGEEVVITRHQKPVARIVPEERRPQAAIRRVADELAALRCRMAQRRGFRPLSRKEIKKAIADGRC